MPAADLMEGLDADLLRSAGSYSNVRRGGINSGQGAADCGEHRQAAGDVAKAVKQVGDTLCLKVRSIGEAAKLEISGNGVGLRPLRGPKRWTQTRW
jgi:hypothetical protein